MPKRLTDLHIWTILHMEGMSDADLATVLGVKIATVHAARWRLRRSPWSCSVRYAPCRSCGTTMTLRGQSPTHAYHPACRPLARKQIQQQLDAARPVTPDMVERLHQWTATAQQHTLKLASRTRAPWTAEEDAVLIALADQPQEHSCRALGRSLYAVRARRFEMRKRGRV